MQMELLKKYFLHRRGRIEPPLEPVGQVAILIFTLTRCVCTNNPFGAVEKVSALVHSPPAEGWQAKPDGVVL